MVQRRRIWNGARSVAYQIVSSEFAWSIKIANARLAFCALGALLMREFEGLVRVHWSSPRLCITHKSKCESNYVNNYLILITVNHLRSFGSLAKLNAADWRTALARPVSPQLCPPHVGEQIRSSNFEPDPAANERIRPASGCASMWLTTMGAFNCRTAACLLFEFVCQKRRPALRLVVGRFLVWSPFWIHCGPRLAIRFTAGDRPPIHLLSRREW